MNKIKVIYYTHESQFNLCSNEKVTQCVMSIFGIGDSRVVVSEQWPAGDCPITDSMLPSEVLDCIEERLESYWFSSRREERRAAIAKIRERMLDVDAAWIEDQIADHERKILSLRAWLASLREQEQI